MLLRQHAVLAPDDPRKLNPQLSTGTAAMILRCMEKDPTRRFQTPSDLENAAYALLTPLIGRPIHQHTASSIELPSKLSGTLKPERFSAPPRAAKPLLILIGFLLLLALFLGFLLWRSR